LLPANQISVSLATVIVSKESSGCASLKMKVTNAEVSPTVNEEGTTLENDDGERPTVE
jgi:hypothetical protein